jgi:hypothetical protein
LGSKDGKNKRLQGCSLDGSSLDIERENKTECQMFMNAHWVFVFFRQTMVGLQVLASETSYSAGRQRTDLL